MPRFSDGPVTQDFHNSFWEENSLDAGLTLSQRTKIPHTASDTNTEPRRSRALTLKQKIPSALTEILSASTNADTAKNK